MMGRISIPTFAVALTLLFTSWAGPLLAQTATNDLSAYSNCIFSDGLQVVQTDYLPSGMTSRGVDTDDGVRQIDMEAGVRIMFAYPETDFYANVKAEKLPASEFSGMKKYLLENFQHLAHGNTINTSLQSPLNGFEVHGLDREKLEGGVLGVYLLFDTSDHTAITIYLLNQEPRSRKFQTMDEYRELRDRFLTLYTTCVRNNHRGSK